MWLWFANRGTGVVLTAVLTLSTALGVLATARASSPRWPRFATQNLHRNVSLLAAVLLFGHALTAVADSFVDLRWYHIFVPFGGDYVAKNRTSLALAAVSLNAIVVVSVTSLLRPRMPHRLWRGIHLLSYVAWAVGVLHGFLIGTDARTWWNLGVTGVSVAVVAVAVLLRSYTAVQELRR